MGPIGYALTQADKDEFNRIKHKVDTIRGPGVTNNPSNITINPPAPVIRVNSGSDDSIVRVRPTSYIGNGVYAGNYITGILTGYNASTGTLTGESAGAAVLIINGPEFGSTASEPYIGNASLGQGYGPLFGTFLFIDPVTSKPTILVQVTGLGC